MIDEGGAFARLAPTFDVARLRADLRAIEHHARARQPGRYHDGEWVGISLRSPGGQASAHPSMPAALPYQDCAALAATPYLREVLARVPGPVLGARVLYLPPGGRIREHCDDLIGFWHGLVRLHVPLETDPRVTFLIDGRRCSMSPGELWYGDFSRRHEVVNGWDRTRVHLIVDVVVTPALEPLFPPGFLERHVPAITYTPAAGPRRRALGRFAADVLVPPPVVARLAALALMGADAARTRLVERATRDGARLAIAPEDGELIARIDGHRVLALVPVGPAALRIRDWTAGVLLHYHRSAPRAPARVILELRLPPGPARAGAAVDGGQLIELPALDRSTS